MTDQDIRIRELVVTALDSELGERLDDVRALARASSDRGRTHRRRRWMLPGAAAAAS